MIGMIRRNITTAATAALLLAIVIGIASGSKNDALYDIEVNLEDLISVGKAVAVADNSKNDPSVLDIAAFNVRVFGRAKMAKPFVVEQLVKIILRYDMILIQEIRDASQRAIHRLLAKVNTASKSFRYNMVISTRLGRTSSKEQYAFIYNEDLLTAMDQYVYNDTLKDIFEREPFVVKFTSSKLNMGSFAVIGIHTSPSKAKKEIDHLVDVYEDAKRRMSVNNVILMGDFNAGCTYVTDWSSIRLATDRRFYWLINDITDTTSGSTECAYDRIVVAGNQLLNAIEPLSPGIFHYDTEYGLTQKQALLVSDHYPVSMKIRTREDIQNIDFTRQFSVKDRGNTQNIPAGTLATILSTISSKTIYKVKKYYDHQKNVAVIEAKLQSASLTLSFTNLETIKKDFNPLISDIQISAAKRHLKELSMIDFLPKNNGFYRTLRDFYKTKGALYAVTAKCKVLPNLSCSIVAMAKNGA